MHDHVSKRPGLIDRSGVCCKWIVGVWINGLKRHISIGTIGNQPFDCIVHFIGLGAQIGHREITNQLLNGSLFSVESSVIKHTWLLYT
jgi:hypothetical protein